MKGSSTERRESPGDGHSFANLRSIDQPFTIPVGKPDSRKAMNQSVNFNPNKAIKRTMQGRHPALRSEWTMLWAILLTCFAAQCCHAEMLSLRSRGKTLVEAESFSATSKEYPKTEPCRKCSGQKNVGYFWKGSWFEIEVQVPQLCEYEVSFRASSERGCSIEVLEMDPISKSDTRLGIVEVPKTLEWSNYTNTNAIRLTLTAGTHTLRFKSLGDGANIDFLTFSANSAVFTTPSKTEGPDKNPLKGFGSGWWRPDDDFASVGFQYIEWGQLEPSDDQFNWGYLKEVLNRVGTRGRHLILRLVVDWDYLEPIEANYKGPKWLLERVGEHRGLSRPDDPSSKEKRATKYNDPVFITEAVEAIEALIDHLKEDPRLFILQAGPIGYWSEWHTHPREDWNASPTTKQAIVDAYLKNLPSSAYTQIRYPHEPAIAAHRKVGYFNDSATLTDHGTNFGRIIEQRELWKYGPITGEWPPNIELEYWQRFFLSDEGEKFLKQGRYSSLMMPETKDIQKQLPSWTRDGTFMKMHRLLGYNLQIGHVCHLVNRDGVLHVELTLENNGIAPFHGDWETQIAILESTSSVTELMPVEADLRDLAPGTSTRLNVISKKILDPSRSYQFGVRVIQPGATIAKEQQWPLDARNAYIVFGNDLPVVAGSWSADHSLNGGWNILGTVRFQSSGSPSANESSFPFQGSVRPLSNARQGQEPKK